MVISGSRRENIGRALRDAFFNSKKTGKTDVVDVSRFTYLLECVIRDPLA